MKSTVLVVAVLAASGVVQGAYDHAALLAAVNGADQHHALLALGSASSSGFATPSGAKTPDGRGSFKLRGHKKSASTGGAGINFDQPVPINVAQQPAAAQLVSGQNLQDTEANNGENKPKSFRRTSAVQSECARCLPPLTIGLLLVCEKLVLLGLL